MFGFGKRRARRVAANFQRVAASAKASAEALAMMEYDKPRPVPDPARERCWAKTGDGSLCGHYALSGRKLCRFHSGQDPFSHAADLLNLSPAEALTAQWRDLQARVLEMGSLLRMMGIDPENLPQSGSGNPDVPPDA